MFGHQALALAGGIGALLWGVSADFVPVRWLLVALAVLSLPAAACLWLLDDPAVGALFLSLVWGGLVSLTWVLMAESLPANHFAKWPWPSPGWACWAVRWDCSTGVRPCTSGAWTRSSGSSSLRPVCRPRWLLSARDCRQPGHPATMRGSSPWLKSRPVHPHVDGGPRERIISGLSHACAGGSDSVVSDSSRLPAAPGIRLETPPRPMPRLHP